MRTVYDIMSDSDECLGDFCRACDDTAAAKFILGEKKISELLQVIAGSKKLFAIMADATQNFDFAAELKKAVNGKEFVLPTGRKKQIALVFGLLYAFDTKKLDLQVFIHNHFESENVNDEFARFGSVIIGNFRANVSDEYRAVPEPAHEPEPEPKPAPQEEKPVRDEEKNFLEFDFFSQSENSENADFDKIQASSLLVCIREIIGIVARDPELMPTEREELMLVCEAFEKAVEYGSRETVKIMYIGLKNTIAVSSATRKLEIQTENLSRLIKELQL